MNNQQLTDNTDDKLENKQSYTLPPRLFIIADEVQPALKVVIYALVLYGVYHGFEYSNQLASTCQTVFGLNAFFIKDLVVCMLIIITLIALCIFLVKRVQSKQTSTTIKPYLFSPRTVYTDTDGNKYSDNNNSTPVISMLIAVVCFAIMVMPRPIILHKFAKDLISFNLDKVNQSYNKKCMAKEKPFARFR